MSKDPTGQPVQTDLSTLSSDIQRLHQAAVDSGQYFYIDPKTGFQVWTARYHLERGFCCESACRHCPFDT